MHDEVNVNIAGTLKFIGIIAAFSATVLFVQLVEQIQIKNDQIINYDFFPCTFNITYSRDTPLDPGNYYYVGSKLIRTTCHNWKGVRTRETEVEGALQDVSQNMFILFIFLLVVLMVIYKVLDNSDEFGL